MREKRHVMELVAERKALESKAPEMYKALKDVVNGQHNIKRKELAIRNARDLVREIKDLLI